MEAGQFEKRGGTLLKGDKPPCIFVEKADISSTRSYPRRRNEYTIRQDAGDDGEKKKVSDRKSGYRLILGLDVTQYSVNTLEFCLLHG